MATPLVLAADSFEDLVSALGTPRLGDAILAAARRLVEVDEVFGFYLADGHPVRLASSGRTGSARQRASHYSGAYHSLDPLLPVIRGVKESAGIVRLSLKAEEITDPAYRWECFGRPGLAEKIAFVRGRPGGHLVIAFYFASRPQPGRMEALAALAAAALSLLQRHGELLADEAGLALSERIERRLAAACPALTARERQVCARTLTGMTAEAIALDLGIAETSVLTYRRRAYTRTGISGSGQLLEHVLD